MLQLEILEIENGYVVLSGSPESRYESAKRWAALNPDQLAELIKRLAIEEFTKRLQTKVERSPHEPPR